MNRTPHCTKRPQIAATQRVAGGARGANVVGAPAVRRTAAGARGMTLVELLVVIIIMTTIVAAAIPLLSPARDDRRLREAARGVNTYISGAIAKAAALRRPYGVALKKLSQDTGNDDDNGVCLELYYVEQPPAFRGFSDTSSVRVALNAPLNKPGLDARFRIPGTVWLNFVRRGTTQNDGLPPGFDNDPLPPSTVRPGDLVRIGKSEYRLIGPDISDGDGDDGFYSSDGSQSLVLAEVVNDSGQLRRPVVDESGFDVLLYTNPDGSKQILRADGTAVDPRSWLWTEPARYSILRQPKPAPGEPYQLPEGIGIDLRGSGISIDTSRTYEPRVFFHHPEPVQPSGVRIDNPEPIVIMFTPEGIIERLRYSVEPFDSSTANEMIDEPVVSNVYLLIGRRENSPPPDIAADPAVQNVAGDLRDPELQKIMAPVNWLNPESRWVVVGSQSGRVTSADNAFVDLRTWSTATTSQQYSIYQGADPVQRRAMQIHAAREFAVQMQQVGGR